jgi:hypothetical protein
VAPPPPASEPEQGGRPALYDADGVPLEGEVNVAGLTLPVGLTAVREAERRHVFTSEIPVRRLVRYFGPRLSTVEVTREGERVAYRNAAPVGVRGGVVRLDVLLEPTTGAATRLEIREHPPRPPAGTQISAEEIQRSLAEDFAQRE